MMKAALPAVALVESAPLVHTPESAPFVRAVAERGVLEPLSL